MAQVKVVGKVVKTFGASNQGLELLETYKGQTGEDYSRTWTVWFAVGHNLTSGQEITVTGLFSNKIEPWVDVEGNPVMDRTGKPGQSIKLSINNAVVAGEVKPVVATDLPF
jgi:hypothetical protein